MFKLVKKDDAQERKILDNKSVFNYITKEISPGVSLAVVTGQDLETSAVAENDRIYFAVKGSLALNFESGEEVNLQEGDSCFVSKGTEYVMSGTFEVITVDQPAFGT